MPLPAFNEAGDLPPGLHIATLAEVIERFGQGTSQRRTVTLRLQRIYRLAQRTGHIQHFIIFGSYVTTNPIPNDIDVVIVFDNEFDVTAVDDEVRLLLAHEQARKVFGASLFWTRPAFLFLETLETFIHSWQIKRDQTQRGIVEVRDDPHG